MIGGVGADFEDLAGEKLRELCQEYRLLIPSTMPDFHEGRSCTYVSTQGFEHRLDYILVSEICRDSILSSWVDQEIDLLNGEKDHRVVMLKMEVTVATAARGRVRNTRLYDRDAARACKSTGNHNLLEDFDFCDWSRDPNDHWAEMRNHIQDQCVKWFPIQKRVRRQIYFSEQTWHMLCQRKELRREHRRLQREGTLRWLKLFFTCWRDKNLAKETVDEWHLINHAGWMQEAVILEARRGVDRQFRKTKRQDWKHWVQDKMHDTVSKLHHAKASDIYKIIQPKKMIDKKKGKRNKHLPGLQDSEGKWNTSKRDVAVAWQKQFATIENADQVDFQQLLGGSVPTCEPIGIDQLLKIPTIYDMERAVRAMSDRKATGVDNIGAEVWQMQVVQTVARVFPLFLKSAIRRQAVVEHTGGWILPLYKGKGNPCKMAGYRAILLEPTLGRIFSKTWRPAIVKGLENVAHAMQWGGRKGLGIEPLHLQVRMWQSNARHCRQSLALVFIDLKTAFYSIVKPMLAGFDGSLEAVAQIFHTLKLPPSAYSEFLANVMEGDLVRKGTQAKIVADNIGASLANTWFTVPHAPQGHGVAAPRTGSRPGDPCADVLFGFVMARMLGCIQTRAMEMNIPLQQACDDGSVMHCVTWVDDVAFAIFADARALVQDTQTLLSIVKDVTIEHGMRMSYGQGKTAAILEFRGAHAKEARRECETQYRNGLQVLSEHEGLVEVPLVSHYKHLGGHVVRGGTKLPEIQIRAALARQNVAPLKKILMQKQFSDDHKRVLVKSLGLSVLRLHSSTWFAMNQSETDAWAAALFRMYQMLEGRDDNGEVEHKDLYQLAARMRAPMPIEMLHIERLRLFVHLLQVFDKFAINAVLHNYRIAGPDSWLHGVLASMRWAQLQVGVFTLPDEIFGIVEWQGWHDLRDAVVHLKKAIKQVEEAHVYRVRTYMELKKQADFQAELCKDMGWTFHTEEGAAPEDTTVYCEDCGKTLKSHAAMAVHQQRQHGQRMAMRRFATDGICRACGKNFHSRCRLLRHLQWGGTRCWLFHLRIFNPLSSQEALKLDDGDRKQGMALHQHGVSNAVVEKAWHWADGKDMTPHLPCSGFEGDPWSDPTEDELTGWKLLGTLPTGVGGRPITARKVKEWKVSNAYFDVSALERKIKKEVEQWHPNFDWIPRPLVQDQKYFLIFFSGHRRVGDIASWLHWDSRITPIAIDLAVDSVVGDVLENGLWQRLILARKVAGGHGGPPCETYSAARWKQIEGMICPQPLRDADHPWGRWNLSLREVKQCFTGTILMLATLKLLLLIYVHNGSITLEHPKGDPSDPRKWSVWKSSFVEWMLLEAQIQLVTFLQGPLGQAFAKPTVMLAGRVPWLASMLYEQYAKGWRPTETLGGLEQQGKKAVWKTSKAKAYPERLSKAIAFAHLRHLEVSQFEGTEIDPEGLQEVLTKLAGVHDPYDPTATGTTMMADYHARKI